MALSPLVREFAIRALILLVGVAAVGHLWVVDTGMLGGFVSGFLAALALVVAFSRWERPWILRPPSIPHRS